MVGFGKQARFNSQVIGIMALLIQSCGLTTNPTPNVTCAAHTAQLAVYDTSIKRICGCTEPSGYSFGVGQSLNCTVSAGTVVYFNYVGIANTHQIAVTGLTLFQERTGGSSVTQTDALPLYSSGTFTFQDTYTTIGGSLIVQ